MATLTHMYPRREATILYGDLHREQDFDALEWLEGTVIKTDTTKTSLTGATLTGATSFIWCLALMSQTTDEEY